MKTIQKLAIATVAIVSMTSCCANDKPKFDAKEYAERKTERLDNIVDLTSAQEKEVYSLYLAQGKEMKKNIKAFKKECGDMKRPDCKKAECKKAEGCDKAQCDKAKCDKPCPQKAECGKPECCKPECKKAEGCDKANCNKPECKKAECDNAKCDKPCPKKAECGKPECCKPECKKAEGCDKANCKKAECKKAECDKPKHRPHRPALLTPEARKETFKKIHAILTPEQSAKLKEHRAKRHACCPDGKQCTPTPTTADK